jgi:hypothetical protein
MQEDQFIKAYYQLSPHTITLINIFSDYSKERFTYWYVTQRAAARSAERLAGYVSKGLQTALESIPSITTKIRSFALMEEKMYYGPVDPDAEYKQNQCFVSLPNSPTLIDHLDDLK